MTNPEPNREASMHDKRGVVLWIGSLACICYVVGVCLALGLAAWQ